MTNDYLNENINISYDHRNLITEINRTNPLEDPPTEIKIRYRYDESGNRTRKTIYQSTIENPPPIPEEGDLPPGWIITTDEYYVRDAQGKEIAIYQGYNLDFWNVWGMGNEGRIKSKGISYFYHILCLVHKFNFWNYEYNSSEGLFIKILYEGFIRI